MNAAGRVGRNTQRLGASSTRGYEIHSQRPAPIRTACTTPRAYQMCETPAFSRARCDPASRGVAGRRCARRETRRCAAVDLDAIVSASTPMETNAGLRMRRNCIGTEPVAGTAVCSRERCRAVQRLIGRRVERHEQTANACGQSHRRQRLYDGASTRRTAGPTRRAVLDVTRHQRAARVQDETHRSRPYRSGRRGRGVSARGRQAAGRRTLASRTR